ncbi:MAG: Regulatory protein luxR family [Subtercola sp.]|nr:Regulatory protein luxR family [Subtercola sp.]
MRLSAAVSAERWADVIELIEHSWSALMSSDIAGLRAALGALPPEVVAEHPRLAAAKNYVDYIPTGDAPRPMQFRDKAAAGHPEALLDVLARLTSRSGARRSAGQFVKAAESVDEAREALADATEDGLIQIQPALPDLHFHWGKAREFAGQGPAAYQEYLDAFDLAVVTGNELVAANAAGSIAWLSAYSGYIEEAERWLARMPGVGAPLTGDSWRHTRHATTSLFARVFMLLGELEYQAAEQVLHDDIDISLSPEYWVILLHLEGRFVNDEWAARRQLSTIAAAIEAHKPELSTSGLNLQMLALTRADAHVRLQQPDRARQILREADENGTHVSQSTLVARARVELVAGDYAAAARYAESVIALSDARLPSLATAMLIEAVASVHLDRHEHAAEQFGQVMQQSGERGFLAMLTAVSRDDLVVLAELTDLSAIAGADEALTQALNRGIFLPPAVSILPLSPRERSVLAELPSGASIAEIATTLRVSHNTIKSQLRSVYRKLGVATREDAEAAAARYGLLG